MSKKREIKEEKGEKWEEKNTGLNVFKKVEKERVLWMEEKAMH